MRTRSRRRAVPLVPVAVFGAVSLVLLALGYFTYRREAQFIRTGKYSELSSLADLKARQLVAWRKDQSNQARAVSAGPVLRSTVVQLLKSPDNISARSSLLNRLQDPQKYYELANVIVARPDGAVLLSADSSPTDLEAPTRELVSRALSTGDVVLGDFFNSTGEGIRLDVVAPILDSIDRPQAALILRVDPSTYLYPLMQWWPTRSRSFETVLVRRDRDAVLLLNQLRHRPEPPLNLRIPLTAANIPAVRAVLGQVALVEDLDYRGVKVLADIRPIPGSPWFMVTKMDVSEAFAETRFRGALIAAFVVMAVLLIAGAMGLAYGYRRRRFSDQLLRSEQERREALETIRATLYSIGDGVIATDAEGRVLRVNPVAEQLTGWREAEARGRPLEDVFRIINEETGAAAETPVRRVLSEGRVIGLANHTVLLARDGPKRPIADSGAPIHGENGAIKGVVLVFRDQTEERQQQAALQESEGQFRNLANAIPQLCWMANADGWIFWYNQRWYEYTGTTPEDMEGWGWQSVHDPQTLPKVLEQWKGSIATGEPFDMVFPLRGADGAFRPFLTRVMPVRDQQGEVTRWFGTNTDIKDQREIEKALRLSEERFRLATETANDVVYEWDLKQSVQWCGRMDELLGYEPGGVPQALDAWVAAVHPEDRERTMAAIQAHLDGNAPYAVEYRVLRKDGACRWWSARGTAVRTPDGIPVRWIGSITDVTERKEAETELRASESRFRQLAESLPQLVWTCQPDGQCDYLSRRWVEFTGVPAAEQLGSGWLNQVHPGDHDGLIRAWSAAVASGGVFRVEFRIRRHDGAYLWFDTQALPLRDDSGRIVKWFGSNTDITEHRRAEEAATRSERRLQFALESAQMGIWELELENDTSIRTLRHDQIFGYPSLLPAWGREIFLSHVVPEDRNAATQCFQKSIATGNFYLECRIMWPDRSIHWICAQGTALRDADGKPAKMLGTMADITEQKLRESRLREQAALLDLVHDAVIVRDPQNRVVFWSRGAEETYGWTSGQTIGQVTHDLLRTTFPSPSESVRAVLEEQGRWEGQLGHVTRDGRNIVVDSRQSIQRDERGAPNAILEMNRDVTARVRAEVALQESEQAFRILAESVPQLVWICNPDGLNIYFNQRWVDYTGLTLEESYGRGWNTPFHPDDQQSAWNAWNHAVATGGTYRVECRLRRADGVYRWFLTVGVPSSDAAERIVKWFGTCTDIDDLKRAQEEVRLAGERLSLALKIGKSGTFDWDISSNVNRWTPEVEALYGLEPGTFGGTFEAWKAFVLPEDLGPALVTVEESFKTGAYSAEWRIRRKGDGAIRWISAQGKVSFAEDGRPVSMLGLNRDVTEAKQAEEEVRRLNAELEQRVADRTVQLQATNKELEAFAYSVSHDLRAPLRALDGFSVALISQYHDLIDDQGKHYLQRIRDGSLRMGQLIDDLLNLSRITRRDFNQQNVDLSELATEITAELGAEEPQRQVECDIALGLAAVGDRQLLRIALQNLLANAWKFTGACQSAHIEFGARDQDGERVFFVRDNGVGFDMAYAGKLFTPFQRLHGMQEFPGTGIGLATVQRIVTRHGGRVWAEAAVGKGAVFCFTLKELKEAL